MTFTISIIVSLAGIIAAGLLFRVLRRRIPEAVASGLGLMVLLLAQYPLMRWIKSEPLMPFMMWLMWSTLGALAAFGFTALRRPKQ